MKPIKDTIVAQANAPGVGGVSIIRLSGDGSLAIAGKLFEKDASFFEPRKARLAKCKDKNKEVIDEGIVLFFSAPHSFTGEDVLEFHCHGGPVLVDVIIKTIVFYGARIARAGEFSERAFLNNKIDLVQAEAIADLISSGSEQAAKNALQSLQGVFSNKIKALVEDVIFLRTYIEAAIDFPDEEGVDFLTDGKIKEKLEQLIQKILEVKNETRQGVLLQEGMTVVITGEPNAGKSSLLNSLSRKDSAIVTDIAGTTRDVLKEKIDIQGIPIHIVDTAGLRESEDVIEQEGIRRAWKEIERADLVLYVIDATKLESLQDQRAWFLLKKHVTRNARICVIENKADVLKKQPERKSIIINNEQISLVTVSAKYHLGLDLLQEQILISAGCLSTSESKFIARRRHINAIEQAEKYIKHGYQQLLEKGAAELLAEDLRLAQQDLGEITGVFTSDDLLGKIFSSFCIGK